MPISVNDLLDAEPRDEKTDFSIHIAAGASEFAALGVLVEVEVFGEVHGLSPAEVAHMLETYAEVSDLVMLVDRSTRQIAGVTRVVRWSNLGLPTFVETAKHPEWNRSMFDAYDHHGWVEPPTKILDVAGVVLRPSYRGGSQLPSMALAHATYLHSRDQGAERWICLLEEAVMEMLIALGMPWQRLCDLPTAEHEGSMATVPLTVTLDQVTECVFVAEGPAALQLSDASGRPLQIVSMPPHLVSSGAGAG